MVAGEFDLVWVQWTLQYLIDAHVVLTLRRLAAALSPSGILIVKENRPLALTGLTTDAAADAAKHAADDAALDVAADAAISRASGDSQGDGCAAHGIPDLSDSAESIESAFLVDLPSGPHARYDVTRPDTHHVWLFRCAGLEVVRAEHAGETTAWVLVPVQPRSQALAAADRLELPRMDAHTLPDRPDAPMVDPVIRASAPAPSTECNALSTLSSEAPPSASPSVSPSPPPPSSPPSSPPPSPPSSPVLVSVDAPPSLPVASAPSTASAPTSTTKLLSDALATPSNDHRSYRLVELANGMHALLVHDSSITTDDPSEPAPAPLELRPPTSLRWWRRLQRLLKRGPAGGAEAESSATSKKMAACALAVGVGYLADPPHVQGLCHFVEHMLFMGTKRFPRENGWNSFLSRHGGSDNGETFAEETVFYFDIMPSLLRPALERFGSFFTCPLFRWGGSKREVQAIDSEFEQARATVLLDFWAVGVASRAG